MDSRADRPSPGPGTTEVEWRRTLGTLAGLTSVAASVGAAQLISGTFTPPVDALSSLGWDTWVLPGIWLATSVALPCGAASVLAIRRSPWLGAAAAGAGLLLLVELLVQIPFVGPDPLQAIMSAVAVGLVWFGVLSHRTSRAAERGRTIRRSPRPSHR